jgi:uncharacterized heparinase superfamily protein
VTGIYVADTTFRFLNVTAELIKNQNQMDWSADEQQRLWQYNLHYFDFLREPSRPAKNKDWLIDSWIESNPQGMRPGWEPFTTSLRIVNWIFYFQQRSSKHIPEHWLASLHLQALWLERNDEKHNLANHYFENLKALFFAGCFFSGKDANRWLGRAIREIPEQLREQTLTDGAHYERSPMYHSAMVENYLDICNFANSNIDLCRKDFVDEVHAHAARGISWLRKTTFPDGTISLFNDSAFGIAASPAELIEYAERLALKMPDSRSRAFELIDESDSGYFGCRLADDMFIIDCGDIGPSYQPGHTHCDFLSYELMLGKRRIVVDTGVCGYEAGPAREYVRSTRAHNTVSVDGVDQSEVWGEFRVARRAKRIHASITEHDNRVRFAGAYRGFFGVKGGIEHHRTAEISLTDGPTSIRTLSITDKISGTGRHVVESYVHLHPDLKPKVSQPGAIGLFLGGTLVATIRISPDYNCHVEPCAYCPEFGKEISGNVIKIMRSGRLPLSVSYEIYNETS